VESKNGGDGMRIRASILKGGLVIAATISIVSPWHSLRGT